MAPAPDADDGLTPEDFAPFAECGQKLSKVQIKAIRNQAYKIAVTLRRDGKWSEAEEAAFLQGVMCAFFACRSQLDLPAQWVLGLGRRILAVVAAWKAEGKLEKGG